MSCVSSYSVPSWWLNALTISGHVNSVYIPLGVLMCLPQGHLLQFIYHLEATMNLIHCG